MAYNKEELFKGQICPFINYYQFFREVLFSLKNNCSFVLLHDERNPVFLKYFKDIESEGEAGLWSLLSKAVPRKYINRISRITIQEIVNEIEKTGRDTMIGSGSLKASKYGLN